VISNNFPANSFPETVQFCPFAQVITFGGLSAFCIHLINLCNRYPSFFESRLGDGLLYSFAFIQSGAANCVQCATAVKPTALYSKDPSTPASFAKPGISRLYKLIRYARNSRNKFLTSVIRKFDFAVSGLQSFPFLVYVHH